MYVFNFCCKQTQLEYIILRTAFLCDCKVKPENFFYLLRLRRLWTIVLGSKKTVLRKTYEYCNLRYGKMMQILEDCA